MCAINGILRLRADLPPVDREELLRTREAMASRGPDGSGIWISEDQAVGLAHRRLAIIDLSPAGLQPMSWDDGRLRIVFNGEIYNYAELRSELVDQGVHFRSHSDTEVVLALYARDGAAMLSRLRGMFALAIWDDREKTLFLARDPYGIKPLYYCDRQGTLRFASQVKALEAGGAVGADVDPAGLVGFLLWGSVPEPYTLRRGIRSVPAAHYVVARQERVEPPRCYHDFRQTPAPTAVQDVSAALADSVRAHLVSDVPVAVFLSAGLDSGLIAALASRTSAEPLTTLTLRFDEYRGTGRDESPLAREVARALGTKHVERHVRREGFLDVWPAALKAMDQPSVDGFNSYVVSRVAHEAGFKVVLSGLGGDELLGSYDSFHTVPRWSARSRALRRVPGLRGLWPKLAPLLRRGTPKLAGMLEHGSTLPGAYFLRRALYLPEELAQLVGEQMARDGLEQYDPVRDAGKYLPHGGSAALQAGGAWTAVHLMESTQYMRNQLLRDADWASMAHSLELRVPLVDVQLRQAIGGLEFEPARSAGKAAVVRRAAPALPAQLWDRPKSGFSIPVMQWVDEQVGLETHPGAASRALAIRVLEGFGVDVGSPRPRPAAVT